MCDDAEVASTTPLRRREPVQDRSRKRVDRILAAAIGLLAEGGIDAVTTRAMASRADVPVATLYQFFPNRDAILHEVLSDYLARRDADSAAALAGMSVDSIGDAVHQIFVCHRAHMRAHPHLVELFYSSRAIGFRPDPQHSRATFAAVLHGRLVEWNLLRADSDSLVVALAVELGDRILEMAHRAGPDNDGPVLVEGERALTTYLQNYAVQR